ncbi:hypothetical protein [Microbacterium sp. KR10-403]|uniref:hypothetical protein n=1 Tax=Microbacterium sp. KR10-403 TaxID=3158581 RepID=UPI0032E378F0
MDAVTEYAQQEEWDTWVASYEWHLDKLPPLLQQMREQQATVIRATNLEATRVSGGGYLDNVRVIDEPGTPAADAAILWALLTGYAEAVADRIGECPTPRPPFAAPDDARTAWRASYELVAWLLDDDRVNRIVEHHDLGELEETLFREVRKGGNRYGLAPERRNRKRLCTICGERGMVAAWIDEGAGTVAVARCERCGNTVKGQAA